MTNETKVPREGACPSGIILAAANRGFPPKTGRFAVVAMWLVLMLAASPGAGH